MTMNKFNEKDLVLFDWDSFDCEFAKMILDGKMMMQIYREDHENLFGQIMKNHGKRVSRTKKKPSYVYQVYFFSIESFADVRESYLKLVNHHE